MIAPMMVPMAPPTIAPPAAELVDLVGFGKPATTPDWDQMWATWRAITLQADKYLDTVTADSLTRYLFWKEKPSYEDIGTLLLRNIYHYWFHVGEAHAILQSLGHTGLPDFVGNMRGVEHSR